MRRVAVVFFALAAAAGSGAYAAGPAYPVVGTNQTQCYDDRGRAGCPSPGAPFYGQDAQHRGAAPQYRDNGDGTVSDLVTGLMWQKEFRRVSFADAARDAAQSRVGGHADWRVPTIKELYSLIDFSGATGSAPPGSSGPPADAKAYLNRLFFQFEYPREGRFIDAQYVTSTVYLGLTMGRDKSFFGVNFADGRIKAYPQDGGPGRRQWYGRWVRGNPAYGKNDFVDNRNGTVADRASGLVWTKGDSGSDVFRPMLAGSKKGDGRLDWGEALAFCENLTFAGRDDWRLPNAKELHSIVDYGRAPEVTRSAALAAVFDVSTIKESDGSLNWPYFWTSTSHLDGRRPGDFAVYIAFGKAMGQPGGPSSANPGGGGSPAPHPGAVGFPGGSPPWGGASGSPPPPPWGGMGGPPPRDGRNGFFGGPPPGLDQGGTPGGGGRLLDVHGAGAQRSSPKSGDEARLPQGAGPQGDVLRIYNHARCVCGGNADGH
jgi:hypothetical protein